MNLLIVDDEASLRDFLGIMFEQEGWQIETAASVGEARAGWTWYTGSASWLHRVVSEWVLGVRPEWDGLRIDPCLPPQWKRARMRRPWRGKILDIEVEQGMEPRLMR